MGDAESKILTRGRPEAAPEKPLFTPRFFLLASYSFVTFFTAFQLYPTMPFRILALGGSEGKAGLFLGLLTFASAFSAPFGGAIADRLGQRHILLVSSSAFFGLSFVFSFARSLWIILRHPLKGN